MAAAVTERDKKVAEELERHRLDNQSLVLQIEALQVRGSCQEITLNNIIKKTSNTSYNHLITTIVGTTSRADSTGSRASGGFVRRPTSENRRNGHVTAA